MMETDGKGNPVMVMVVLLLQFDALVPVTVYVILAVEDGVTFILLPVVALKPVAGLHVYVTAPLAAMVYALPTQVL